MLSMYFYSNVIWYYSAFTLLGHFMSVVNEQKYPEKKFWYSRRLYLYIGVVDGLLGITYQIQYVVSLVLGLLYGWFFFRNERRRNVISACIFSVCTLLVHYAFELLGDYWIVQHKVVPSGSITFIYPIVSASAVVFLFVVYRCIMLYQFKDRGIKIGVTGWMFFAGSTVYSILFIYLIVLIHNHPHLYSENDFLIFLLLLGLVLFNTFSLTYGKDIELANLLIGKLKSAEERSRLDYEYYKSIENRNEECKKLLHDVKNHIQVIEALYQSGERGEAEEYAATLLEQIENSYQKCYSSHKIIDIILQDKEKKAKENQVRMHYIVEELDWSLIKDFDLSTILCNLLDNAIACCEQLPEENRDIYVKLRKVNGFQVFYFENPIDPDHVKEMEYKELRKRVQTGTGLQNVRRVVRKNKGEFSIDIKEKQFCVTITFGF